MEYLTWTYQFRMMQGASEDELADLVHECYSRMQQELGE